MLRFGGVKQLAELLLFLFGSEVKARKIFESRYKATSRGVQGELQINLVRVVAQNPQELLLMVERGRIQNWGQYLFTLHFWGR